MGNFKFGGKELHDQYVMGSNTIDPTPGRFLFTLGGSQLITKIEKQELLKILRENRDKHLAIFTEAAQNYRLAAIRELNKSLKMARKGHDIRRNINLMVPVNKIEEYERAIRMLEMTTETVVELDENQFAKLVLNQWAWRENFLSANMDYLSDTTKVLASELYS